jgi:two-component system cell cycle sensor histidine kinase/response regulator CckA
MSAAPQVTNRYDAPQPRYEQLLASVEGIIWEADPETFQFCFVSRHAERLLGYPLHQWRAPGFWVDHLHPDDRDRAVEYCLRATRELRNHDIEYRMLAADGRVVWLRDSVSLAVVEGAVTRIYGIMIDITDRKRAEELLHVREELYRLLTDTSNDLIALLDLKGGTIYASPSVGQLLGNDQAQLAEIARPERVHAEEFAEVVRAWWEALAGRRQRITFRYRHTDGAWRWLEVWLSPVKYLGRLHIMAVGRDVSEGKRAEQALVESYNLLHAVVEGTPDAVVVKDLQGRYLMINSAAARLLGKTVEEVVGNDDRTLFPSDVARAIVECDRHVMTTREPRTIEESGAAGGATRSYLTTKDVYRDARGAVIGLIGISRDVTELKRLEAQFRQAQKMEAVGRLAGGVAHDFNNLLTVIIGNNELVFGSLATDDPSRELLAEIQQAGTRAINLTRQLLAFSRKQTLQPEIVSLNTLLGELLKLLQRLIGENIELALMPGAKLSMTKVDPGQFEQAIINLVVNARDAMPQGGRLSIETADCELDEEYSRLHPDVAPGQYVLVAISDSGHGMDEATKARIFEPFFTTKPPGKGTGLGLAMVYGFVKQSGGHIEMYSEWERGTTCKIYLPRADEAAPAARLPPDLPAAPKGTETVLVVEDEAALRNLIRLILQASGYTVLEARDGQEAFWVAQQHAGPLHLVLTDLVMPRMSGRQLAELLARSRPEMRILFMSGYTEEAAVHHGVLEGGAPYLQKPFNSLGLARKVREILDAEDSPRQAVTSCDT